MTRPASPCKDCTRRAPGCHNEETCPPWKAFQLQQKQFHAARATVRTEERIADDYRIQRAIFYKRRQKNHAK